MTVELKIPNVGESIQEVQIGRWLKKAGDRVEQDENVVELETDKASMELSAPVTGVLQEILKEEGASVSVGETIASFEKGDAKPAEEESRAERKPEQPEPEQAEPEQTKPERQKTPAKQKPPRKQEPHEEQPPAEETEHKVPREQTEGQRASKSVHATPSGRRALLEYGLSADEIETEDQRIRREDVLRHVEQQQAKKEPSGGDGRTRESQPPQDVQEAEESGRAVQPAGDKATSAREEVVPMTLIRRRIAARLVEAQQTAALLTTFNEIDMSAVLALRKAHGERFRERYGVKLGFMSFFVKATIDALQEYPGLNAEVRGTDIIYRNYFHIGIAIGSRRGLVVPVLRHAERMSFAETERTIGDFAKRAQENKLGPDELAGGTFTITNGGVYGSLLSTPIVNPPQSGVLGMHAIQDRPVAHEGQVIIRPMMYVALTYDHRIVDGQEAVSCLRRMKEAIEDPARMLIEV